MPKNDCIKSLLNCSLLLKLLFDNNLSVLLPARMEADFPGSTHVYTVGLAQLRDNDIWQYALINNFTICTKDKDFYHLANARGHPPKVVWLAIGNCTNQQVIELLLTHTTAITRFIKSNKSILLLP